MATKEGNSSSAGGGDSGGSAGGSLQRLADVLGVSCDYLIEGATTDAAKADFKDRELLRQFQEVEKLPDDDKLVIKKLLNAFLMQKRLETMMKA